MVFVKDNAADGGLNRWTINGMHIPTQWRWWTRCSA